MARSGAAIGTIRVPAVLLGCVNTSERCTTLCTNPGGKSQRRCGQCPGLCTPHCQPAGPESVGSPQPCTCCLLQLPRQVKRVALEVDAFPLQTEQLALARTSPKSRSPAAGQ